MVDMPLSKFFSTFVAAAVGKCFQVGKNEMAFYDLSECAAVVDVITEVRSLLDWLVIGSSGGTLEWKLNKY